MIAKSKPFSREVTLAVESGLAFRRTIKLLAGEEKQISLILSISEDKQEAIQNVQKYQSDEKIKQAIELGKARSEAENEYLGIRAKQAETYQTILGYLLKQNPLKNLNKFPIQSYPQDGLWKFGISGDIPILTIRIQDPNDDYVIRNMVKAKEFFMLKKCDVDLVILNEEKNAYEKYVKEKIENAIMGGGLAYLINQPNGIFIIEADTMKEEDKNLLLFRSNFILDAGRGKVWQQIEEMEEAFLASIKKIGDEKAQAIMPKEINHLHIDGQNLKYYNEYGGFSEDGKEYIIAAREGTELPTVWSHILANEKFGTLVTDQLGGFTWSKNSRLNRMTSWNNLPYLDIPSEILYIKDEETGKLWSDSSFISKEEGDFKITYGLGYAEYFSHNQDILCEEQIFVPKEESVKIRLVKLKNTRPDKRKLKLVYYIKPVLGENEEKANGYIHLQKENKHILRMNNLSNTEFKEEVIVGSSLEIKSFTGNRNFFIGTGTIKNPEGLQKVMLDGENSLRKDSIIAFQMELELEAFEAKELSIFLAAEETKAEAIAKAELYQKIEYCKNELNEVKKMWFEKMNRLQVKTPVESMNILLNGWLVYQTITSRLWAKSAYYQSGGAFGFRDQLQDTLGLKYIAPEFMKNQILKASRHQFIEGDVEHWWHEETGRGIRTRFSDDLLWLAYVVAEYIKIVGEDSILNLEEPYLIGEVLPEGVDERYDLYLEGDKKESIYWHCIRAIEKALNFGENGLPKIGSGDWNDGFSTVGNKGKGESVWLGFFLYDVLEKWIPICKNKQEEERAARYQEIKEELKKALNREGWDGRWFKRAFMDNGKLLGSVENEECKIDNISQSWAVISGAADNDKQYIAMESLENHLVDKENGIIKLLDPPFEKSDLEPGYIKAYLPGVRENGGQYTHAAIWTILAEAKLGMGNKAEEYFRMINPIEHARTKDAAWKYKVEPYVIAADIYSNKNLAGRGGWTWYTGSSSWMYIAGIQYVLGLNIADGYLWLNPNIASSWREYSIRYKWKETTYQIKVRNPNGKQSGITKMLKNGEEVPDKKIKLEANMGTIEIDAEM